MKEYLISTNAREDIRNQSKLDMAKSMGLISESEYGGYRAKNFAVLMFTEKPDKFIPYAHVEIIREAIGTDKMEAKIFRFGYRQSRLVDILRTILWLPILLGIARR